MSTFGVMVGQSQLLDETVLTSTATSISLSSTPGTFKDLWVVCGLRSDRAGVEWDTTTMRFNSDTGSNYRFRYTYFDQAGTSNTGSDITTRFTLSAAAATADSGTFDISEFLVMSYADTSQFRHMVGTGSSIRTSASNLRALYGGVWKNSANAITSISFEPEFGTNWVAGCFARLYAIGA